MTMTTSAPYLAVGALHTVLCETIEDLYPVVDSLRATATDPFVLETAAWVVSQATAKDERLDTRMTDG